MATEYYRSTATKMLLDSTHGEPKGIPIYDPVNRPADRDHVFPKGVGFGHDPDQYVPDMMAAPSGMKTYSEADWDALYDEQEDQESSLEHMYLRENWENLDQDGDGYCWSYSSGHAVMLRRMVMHLPHVRLNPHSVAAIIKNGRDEGGWCGLSLPKYRDMGCAVEGTGPGQWPLHSRNLKYNTQAMRDQAAAFKVTADWYDLGKPVYSQQLKVAQLATCLFNLEPSPVDYNEWSHSICAVRWVRVSKGEWWPLILNSWKGWGRRGLAVIKGWDHDGAVSVVNSLAA